MAHPVWPSNLTDFAAIGATPDAASHFTRPNTSEGSTAWGVENFVDASLGVSYGPQSSVNGVSSGMGGHSGGGGEFGDGSSGFPVAPDGFAFLPTSMPLVIHTPPISSGETIHGRTVATSNGFHDFNRPRSTFMAQSPAAVSDHSDASAYSTSSDNSESAYPSPGPQAYTALGHSNSYVAEPLISSPTAYYQDYFANTTENLCVFNDIEAQYYPSSASIVSSESPVPSMSATSSMQGLANYSGPIRNHIVNMSTDQDGVVWIVFPYSKNKEVKIHTIRCDVHTVPPSELRDDIKTVATAAYPMVGGIILGERNFKEYTGKRFAYEWDCCWLGWSLAQLNPTLLEQKGLLQRATDNVASFVFEGCMSRTKLKTHRNEKHKTRDSALPLHEWHTHMLPRPEWLPGLDQDKKEKERLKKLYSQTVVEYEKHMAPKGVYKDPKSLDEASRAAVAFYHRNVTGAALTLPTNRGNATESGTQPEVMSLMNYINIPADPHIDPKESRQIRVNVLLDRVRENIISESVKYEGMVFIDVFDTTGMPDTDLKAKINAKKSLLEYYRNNDIGLVKPDTEYLPPLADLIRQCGLSLDEYEKHWNDFKIRMNGWGFKIKYLDTNNRHQKITNPLLMQRVLFEILRRSQVDNPDHNTKKRKLDNTFTETGKFAEERYDRKTRGARPGRADWTMKKRRTDSEWQAAEVKRVHNY